MGPRTIRKSLQYGPLVSVQNAGESQSTPAAQIVDNLIRAKHPSRLDNRASFQQLIQELLFADNDGSSQFEKDIDVNYRLVYVVAKVGLEGPSQKNPLDGDDDCEAQASNSLEIIDLTLHRCSGLLLYSPKDASPLTEPNGPLFLWLLPVLLRLMGRCDNSKVFDTAARLVRTIATSKSRPAFQNGRLHPITSYLRGCVKDSLFLLKNLESADRNNPILLDARVPGFETISNLYPFSLPRDNLSALHQVSFNGPCRLASVIVGILLALLPASTAKVRPHHGHAVQSVCLWSLDGLARVWSFITPERSLLNANVAASSICSALYLEALRISMSFALKIRHEILATSKSAVLLSRSVSAFLQVNHKAGHNGLESAICWAIFDLLQYSCTSKIVFDAVQQHLMPIMAEVLERPDTLSCLTDDLKRVLSLACKCNALGEKSSSSPVDGKQIDEIGDLAMREAFLSTFGPVELGTENTDPDRPRKRVRRTIVEKEETVQSNKIRLIGQIYALIGLPSNNSLKGLSQDAPNAFPNVSEDDQCSILTTIGELACAGAESLLTQVGARNPINLVECSVCDRQQLENTPRALWDGEEFEALILTVAQLVKLPQMQKLGRPRVAAMTAIRKLLNHSQNGNHFDLTSPVIGTWCLQALRSSLRDLRIAAGRTIIVFLHAHVDSKLLRRNNIVVLDFLRSLSRKNDLAQQETCILTWGQIVSISDGDETNIALLRLVEYLGHTNPLIRGLAYDELQKLSNHSSLMATYLLSPYWSTIAIAMIQDLQTRPQIAQFISDLLNVTVSNLLQLTQSYTIPYLVLTKKRQLLQKVADACGASIYSICMRNTTMAAILAKLLLRASVETESIIMPLLVEVAPEFDSIDLFGLARAESVPAASELLKTASEEDAKNDSKAHGAIHLLASITHRRSGPARGSARRGDMIGPFFETYALGIMAQLSDTISEIKGPQPVVEKRRCLAAIREMIKLAKCYISSSLPQICACLRSAIENEQLCNQAFNAWLTLLDALGEEDLETLVDPTFAIISRHWEDFNTDVQEQTYDAISQLLKSHAKMVRDMVNTIPSLAPIPLMSKFEDELGKLKAQMDIRNHYQAFSQRCQNENATVVARALIELEDYLAENQGFLHVAAIGEQPDPVVAQLTRSILDACVRFSESHAELAVSCARCLGLVGCLDPTRIDAAKDIKDILVLSNFEKADETVTFVVFFLCEILVKEFLSVTDTRSQGFLAYGMQELLKFCRLDTSAILRSRDSHSNENYRRWVGLSESVRNTLTPFLTSKYTLTAAPSQPARKYPIFSTSINHGSWLRAFVLDLLQKGHGENASDVFQVCRRTIRGQDVSVSGFLLPFVVLNVIVSGVEFQKQEIAEEILAVLGGTLPQDSQQARENVIACSQNIFQTLDYLSRWMQEKRKEIAESKLASARGGHSFSEAEYEMNLAQVQSVSDVLSIIPAEITSRRAVECKSFARALYHWEQYIRQQRSEDDSTATSDRLELLYERLQDIYTQIDEPDGIEGISAHLHVLNVDQQVLEHRKAGRWTAAQSWYELLLSERPDDVEVQLNLLTCLKESGQYDVLLNQVEGFQASHKGALISMPFAAEASWVTSKWDKLDRYLSRLQGVVEHEFNVGIGSSLLALYHKNDSRFLDLIDKLRYNAARSLSASNTASLQFCRDIMLKFHVLTEIEAMSGVKNTEQLDRPLMVKHLHYRLDILGASSSDKQYLLGLRRAVMQLSKYNFSNADISSAWLTSAGLARKGNFTHQAFNAVLHASQLGDDSATIEHSRLLWKEGHHRKAIQSLEGAITANAFKSHNYTPVDDATVTTNQDRQQEQNLLTARAHLLLAKWIDRAGQTQSDFIVRQYRKAVDFHCRWEKGHYYLGKHYNKLLESEKAKPPSKQAQTFVSGETAKLVIENYLRSLAFGAKYIFQTLPRILTLWLELGTVAEQPLEPKYGNDENFRTHIVAQRRRLLDAVNSQMKKYITRLPAFTFYTAFSQIVARICHPNQTIYGSLVDIVTKVISSHPQQSLWVLLALIKSSSRDRAARGLTCMTKILESSKKSSKETTGTELRSLVVQAQKLSDQLLNVCEREIKGRPSNVSLNKDLGFLHKFAPCRLVIPLESTLTSSLPPVSNTANMKTHKAFSKETITISAFLDDVVILNSLQRPRKISVRGSDGRVYGLLCKPKDDLRKDQRLMEFNAMINRALKKDAESSKRRLYIKTYAVTPLNDECGLIEWVDNLKTLRDILQRSYKQNNVPINYGEIRLQLDEACSDISKVHVFTRRILSNFPPVFHEWFIEMFPEAGAWFTARLRYTRSCAVMSMVGYVLGLGDRHGENILFEEGNGGTFHVDFNCLFDKGLTFEKPELVPFRLTHNMVDAFGAYGCEGPFRKSSELTLGVLRMNEDTLMTILETFLYDPTTDFIGRKKRNHFNVPDTPEGVLESVRNKVRGLLPMESMPLSVEGHVHELIEQATDPMRLASMYIGWCAFF